MLARQGQHVQVNIYGRDVYVRKGTPDLLAAMSCFSGEFKDLRGKLPQAFDGVIVDAGGYIGTSAIAMRNLYPNAKLVVIEPSRENITVLRKNLAGFDNIEIVYGALVGKSIGTITLKNRGTGEWGFTAVHNPEDVSEATQLHETPAFTLSEVVEDIDTIGILKLDIEGGEADILRHDAATLKRIPLVFAELHDRIVEGCSDLFFDFSKDREVEQFGGEKFLSVRK
ncbi:MAG: FkbM family methyltransferase [Pseudomonadota bacterium]